MIQDFNSYWLYYLNSFMDSELSFTIFSNIADLPIFFLPIFLISLWLYYVIKKQNEQKKGLLYVFYSTCVALLINIVIQNIVHFERPETAFENSSRLILEHIPDASFPSDHTAVSMAFVTAIYLLGFRKTALIFLPFALAMNISRIVVGVHWPLDVIAGTIIGIFSAFFVFKCAKNWKITEKVTDGILKIAAFFRL